MDLGLRLQRLIGQWRLRRAMRPAAQPAPDPADCGTAWGLDLTVRPPSAAEARPAPRRQRL